MADDLIDELVAQLYAAAPELGHKRIRQIAVKLRHDMGGTSGYIRKDPNQGKAESVAESLAGGATLSGALERAGLQLRSGYSHRFVRRWGFS